MAKTMPNSPSMGDRVVEVTDNVQGSQAWNSIFRPGLDLPEGLHRQPP